MKLYLWEVGRSFRPASFLYADRGHMPKDDVVQRIIEALEAAATNHDIDIVDVEVVGSVKAPVVRVRIDHADENAQTISLDEVAAETGWISLAIDELDPFPNSFTLEVSSPGMSRPLRRAHDFERFAGNEVSLQTTASEGRRRFTGKLLGMRENTVVLESEGQRYEIPLDEVKKCTLKPSFDFSAQAKN